MRWLAVFAVTAGCVGEVGVARGFDSGAAAGAAGGGRMDAALVVELGFRPIGAPIALPGIANASDITWNPETDTFFVVADRAVHEYRGDFAAPLRTIVIADGALDAEGIVHLGAAGAVDRFAMALEAPSDVVVTFELARDATFVDAEVLRTYVPAPAPALTNKGWEGVAYQPATGGGPGWLYACREGEPGQVAMRVVRFRYQPAGQTPLSYADGSLAVEEPWNALARFGDVAGDLSGLHYDTATDSLLVLSQLGSRLMRVDPASGVILGQLLLDRSPQYEGVTLTTDGRLVVVSEPNFVEIFRRRER
jgi:uncharacterized protein YjiK